MSKLDQLKAIFTQKQSTFENGNSNWEKFYPFWKMQIGEQAIVRFLPDLDQDNPLGFMVENLTHTLVINGQKKTIPCLSMFGESCPCCELSRKYYDENNDELGKKYYKKKEYIGQVVVVQSPFEYKQEENPVKLIQLGAKIFKLIQAAFASGDLEEVPYEFKGGYDFRIIKSQQGKWASYDLSKFAPKQSDVSEEVLANIDLYNLADFRTKPISREAMETMILADQTGRNYEDTDATDNVNQSQTSVTEKEDVSQPNTSTSEAAQPAPSQVTSSESTSSSPSAAQDILKQIRERAAAAKAAQG